MPRRPRPVPVLGCSPFRGSTAVRDGLLTSGDLRGPAWQRVFPDIYVSAGIELTHDIRLRAALVLFPTAVVSGRSAARIWGIDVDGPGGAEGDVEITLPLRRGSPSGTVRHAGQQRVAGIRARRGAVLVRDVTAAPGITGLRVTRPAVTALDVAADLPHDEAVVVLDQFCARNSSGRRLTELDTLRELAATRTGRGCRLVRAAADDADGRAESPQETRFRLIVARSDLPAPTAQHEVRDADGRQIARVDFAWEGVRLAVEYDGLGHLDRLGPDRRRMNDLQAAGWRIFYVTAADLHHPERLVARIAQVLAECAAR